MEQNIRYSIRIAKKIEVSLYCSFDLWGTKYMPIRKETGTYEAGLFPIEKRKHATIMDAMIYYSKTDQSEGPAVLSAGM